MKLYNKENHKYDHWSDHLHSSLIIMNNNDEAKLQLRIIVAQLIM